MHPIKLAIALLALLGIASTANRLPAIIEKEKMPTWQAWLLTMLALVLSPLFGIAQLVSWWRRAWSYLWFRYTMWKIKNMLDMADRQVERDIELRKKEKADDGEGEVRSK